MSWPTASRNARRRGEDYEAEFNVDFGSLNLRRKCARVNATTAKRLRCHQVFVRRRAGPVFCSRDSRWRDIYAAETLGQRRRWFSNLVEGCDL